MHSDIAPRTRFKRLDLLQRVAKAEEKSDFKKPVKEKSLFYTSIMIKPNPSEGYFEVSYHPHERSGGVGRSVATFKARSDT